MEEARSTIDEAFEVMRATEEYCHHAELYWLKGRLVLACPEDLDMEAEACFQQAIKITHEQVAKSWELSAATSLARLWQRQGKHHDAHELLAPVCEWFTEGFDTANLQEAKALLVELSE